MSDKLKDIVKHGWHPEKDVNLSGGLVRLSISFRTAPVLTVHRKA